MMIDTSPWSSCSCQSPWLGYPVLVIQSGPSVSPFRDFFPQSGKSSYTQASTSCLRGFSHILPLWSELPAAVESAFHTCLKKDHQKIFIEAQQIRYKIEIALKSCKNHFEPSSGRKLQRKIQMLIWTTTRQSCSVHFRLPKLIENQTILLCCLHL